MGKIRLTKEQGKRINRVKRIKKITHKELSKKLKYSDGAVCKMLSGIYDMPICTLNKICEILDISVAWVLDGGICDIDMPENTMGERIRKAITQRFNTLAEFADYAGVDRTEVSNWCTDTIRPSLDMLIVLHDALKVSTDYILLGGDNG